MGQKRSNYFFIIIDNKSKVGRDLPNSQNGKRSTPFQKASRIKIIEKHKTEDNMEKARISGVEPRSLSFKQLILTDTKVEKSVALDGPHY